MSKHTEKGWAMTGPGIAKYNGGEQYDVLVHGKPIGKAWTLTAKATAQHDGGIIVAVDDEEYTGGMAHGGAYTSITIPRDILQRLIGHMITEVRP